VTVGRGESHDDALIAHLRVSSLDRWRQLFVLRLRMFVLCGGLQCRYGLSSRTESVALSDRCRSGSCGFYGLCAMAYAGGAVGLEEPFGSHGVAVLAMRLLGF
jgi:hypothetical protein